MIDANSDRFTSKLRRLRLTGTNRTDYGEV